MGIRYNIYTVFLEIFAGFVLGNIIGADLPENIVILSDIGVLALMFMAGLEVDFKTLSDKWRKSVWLGSMSYIVPFIFIFFLTFFLFGESMNIALLSSIALVPASVGIVYSLLRTKGPLGSRRKMILSSVMITDLLSMILLGVFFSNFSYFTILLFVLIILAFKFLPRFGKFLFSHGGSDIVNIEIKFALAIILAANFFALRSGIDGVLIAFLFGMACSEIFSGSTVPNKLAEEKLSAVVFGFLTPIFFFATGFGISFFIFLDYWYIIVLLVIFTFAVKWLTVYTIGSRIFPNRIRSLVMLFNTPLSIGIVAVGIGAKQGIITNTLAGILALVIIISSLIGVLFTKYPAADDQKALYE